MTSAAIEPISGKRPILVHMRKIMFYSLDAIVNWLSMWRKTFKKSVSPLVIRATLVKDGGRASAF